MPQSSRVYTRSGDNGSTGLGSGERVPKSSARIIACGTVDELNAQLGVVLAAGPVSELVEPLQRIQNELFHLGAELCVSAPGSETTPGPRIEPHHVTQLEKLIDRLGKSLRPPRDFVRPGGCLAAAHLHSARTICRRAERDSVRLSQEEPIGEQVIPYLNRLSDVLFVMARYQNKAAGVNEATWERGG